MHRAGLEPAITAKKKAADLRLRLLSHRPLCVVPQTDRQTDRQIYIHIYGWTDGGMDGSPDRGIDRWIDK
jgi:hypothetical protein